GCKGLVDCLVRVSDANPVSVFTRKLAKNLLLQPTAVLGLVFKDVGPAILQALEKFLIRINRLQREPNQIIKINRAPVFQTTFVGVINAQAHFSHWHLSSESRQVPPQSIR